MRSSFASSRCVRWLTGFGVVALALLPVNRLSGGTTLDGFIDEWLILGGYNAGNGCTISAADMARDYLCDGETNQQNIIPESGLVIGPPVLDPAECEGVGNVALTGLHPAAFLDASGDPQIFVSQPGETLVFDGEPINGDQVMAYAWAYVNNLTGAPLPVNGGVSSDDSVQVEINRVVVFSETACRPCGGAGVVQSRFSTTLMPGGNLVTLKIFENGGGWCGRLRFEDAANCTPLVSGEGQIEVGIDPIELFESPAQRSIVASTAGDVTTANITIDVDTQGSYNLRENFDAGWQVSNVVPAAEVAGGQIRWTNVTAARLSYTLARTGEFNTRQGRVEGVFSNAAITVPVGGATSIPGGIFISPFPGQVLVTASFNMDDPINNPGIQGCNVPVAQIEGEWISGEDGDGNEYTDATIVPREDLEIRPDWDNVLSNGMDFIGDPFLGNEWWIDAADEFGPSRLVAVETTDGSGFYDWQAASIYASDPNLTMNIAYFYAVNPDPDPMDVVIGFGSDDSGGVRVNGVPVHSITACRGFPGFTDKAPVRLYPGHNLVSVYTFENGGGYNMGIRFEDQTFTPAGVETTIDPGPYGSGGAGDNRGREQPEEFPGFVLPIVPEVLVTPSISMVGSQGCNVPVTDIRGDWISGEDGDGNEYTDESIVPREGMVIFPDWLGEAPNSGGWSTINNDAFFDDPADPISTGGVLRVATSGNSFWNWQRADIYNADVNQTMNVAFFYAINDTGEDMNVNMGFGSDDSGGVRVNGCPVHAITACRGDPGFADKFPVTLRPGKNLVSFYTFENGGGYNVRIRFEDENGNGLGMKTTIDPTGYEPIACDDVGGGETPAVDANGFVNVALVPANVLDQPFGATGPPGGQSLPGDWISIDGEEPNVDNVFPGALVGPAVDPDSLTAVATGVRGTAIGVCNATVLVKAEFPGSNGFNGESFYAPNPDNYTSTGFVFLNNKTDEEQTAIVGFASDDSAALFVNGELILEHVGGRGWGAAGTIQNGPAEIILEPGANLLQISYLEGGGGSGFRLRVAENNCGDRLDPEVVEVSALPPGFEEVTATRAIETTVAGDGRVTARVTVTVEDPPGRFDLLENFNPIFTVSEISPGGVPGPDGGNVAWTNVAGPTLSYTLTLDGACTRAQGGVSGIVTLGQQRATVGGDSRIAGCSHPGFVSEVLVTPSIDMAPSQGCSVTPEEIESGWVSGEDQDGNEYTDATIVPRDGLAITPRFGEGLPGELDGSIGAGWDQDAMSVAAIDRFFPDAGGIVDPLGPGIIRAATTTSGLFDWQVGSIYGGDVNQSMNVAYFYVDNQTGGKQLVRVGFGSDDSGAVRVNGFPVWTNQACRGHPGFADKFSVNLDEGKNLFAVYTFENGGGYNMCIRFEDENGVPIALETTIDPEGYSPEGHDDPRVGGQDIGILAPSGAITQFLAPLEPIESVVGNSLQGVLDDTFPEDWITIDGEPASVANVRPGATVTDASGVVGSFIRDIDGDGGVTSELVLYDGANGTFGDLEPFLGTPGDPGLFNGELVYGPARDPGDPFLIPPDNYTSTLFFFLNNLTDAPTTVWLAFASDDSAALFVNGENLAEHRTGRGFGGANQFQTGPVEAELQPGVNLVQFSYTEGGGGSGGRVFVFDGCLAEPLDTTRVVPCTDVEPEAGAIVGTACDAPPPVGTPFIRGDVTADGALNITDAVRGLGIQFLGTPPVVDCMEIQDVNDDGNVNITDPIASLGFQFLGGPPPRAPFPTCGLDPEGSVDSGCESFPPCE